MKAIFITRDNPYPPVNGYKKRNYYLIEELKKRDIETEVYIAESRPSTFKKILAFICSLFCLTPFSVKIRTNKELKDYLNKYLTEKPVDLIICDGIHKCLNIPLNAKGKKLLYEHNIESEIAKRYASIEPNILKKAFAFIEYLKFKNLQKKIWPYFDYCVSCSELDKEYMTDSINRERVLVVNNGVDLDSFSQWSTLIEPNTLVYTGQIGWHPNEDALVYFNKKIMPIIKKEIPAVKLWIVGANPSNKIKSLAIKTLISKLPAL